jgi:DNA-binding IclR family transcriptional regulator
VRTDGTVAPLYAPADEGRGLSTARSVLRVLAFLGRHPEGVRARDVAAELGKSTSTAYYLLASLCEEGFAVHDQHGGHYRLRRDRDLRPEPGESGDTDELAGAVDALFRRTHKRSYLGRLVQGALEIVVVRGRQGMPRVLDLGTRITDGAHAVAMGKIVLAWLPEDARRHYVGRSLRRYTGNTIVSQQALMVELDHVRRRGFATETEEFHEDSCGVAAPILDPRGRFHAALGLTATRRAYESEREQLAGAVVDMARLSKHLRKNKRFFSTDA